MSTRCRGGGKREERDSGRGADEVREAKLA